MQISAPFNLKLWIDQNRHLLKPPVGNKLLFQDSDLIVMAVGGPNSRKDFLPDPGEELFLQLEGDIVLRIVENGPITDMPVRAGGPFPFPAVIPPPPQLPAGTSRIVFVRR